MRLDCIDVDNEAILKNQVSELLSTRIQSPTSLLSSSLATDDGAIVTVFDNGCARWDDAMQANE